MGTCANGGVVYNDGAQSRPSAAPDASQGANRKLARLRQMLAQSREDAGLSPRTVPQSQAQPDTTQNHQQSVFAQAAQAATTRQNRMAVSGPQMSAERTGSPAEASGQFRTVKQNLKFATDAVAYVRTLTTTSTNREADKIPVRDEGGTNAVNQRSDTLDEIRDDIDDTRQAARWLMPPISNASDAFHVNETLLTKATGRHYESMAMTQTVDEIPSNCAEKTSIAFDFLAQLEANPHLDIVSLESYGYPRPTYTETAITNKSAVLDRGPDHVMLVIGRDPSTDPTSPSTWGETTVICDPWAERSYPVARFNEEMTLLSSTSAGAVGTTLMHSLGANTPYDPEP